MDDSISGAHSLLCWFYIFKREHEKAIAEAERAVALNPGGTTELTAYATSLNYVGRLEESIQLYQKAIRLNPFGPSYFYQGLAICLRTAARYEEAVSAFKKAIQIAPDDIVAHRGLAATYSMMGREKEAHAEAAEVLRINPKFSADSLLKRLLYKDQSETERIVNAMRKAGLK